MSWDMLLIIVLALLAIVAMVRKREFVEIKVPFFRITFRDKQEDNNQVKSKDS
jgi:hypothetical protein